MTKPMHLPFLTPTELPLTAYRKGVALLGLPRTGKTTLGRTLAQRLAWRFIDSDAAIAQEAHTPIPDLIAQKGIEHFRNLERQWLSRQVKETKESMCVLSTGGGMPCNLRSLALLNRHFVTVHLTLVTDVWLARMADPPHELIQRMKQAELLNLYTERQVFYAQAHVQLSNRSTLEADVQNILHRVFLA